MNRNGQRGGGGLKAVVWIAILAALVYLAVKIVPHVVNNYELQDTMDQEARFAMYQRKTDMDVRDLIFRKAQSLDISGLRKDDIKVQISMERVTISVNYTVPVELPGYTLNLSFSPSADNKRP